jgi:hypothetical protein
MQPVQTSFHHTIELVFLAWIWRNLSAWRKFTPLHSEEGEAAKLKQLGGVPYGCIEVESPIGNHILL